MTITQKTLYVLVEVSIDCETNQVTYSLADIGNEYSNCTVQYQTDEDDCDSYDLPESEYDLHDKICAEVTNRIEQPYKQYQ